MKKELYPILVIVIVFLVASIPFGILVAKIYSKHNIVENCTIKITIAEDTVFDESEVVNLYGEAIKLHKGKTGTVNDPIHANTDAKGYEYINAIFALDNGKSVSVAVSTDADVDKDLIVSSEMINNVIPVIGINRIDSSESVLNEYKLSRERYYARVRKARIISCLVSFVGAIMLSTILAFMWRYLNVNDKPVSGLLGIGVTLDMVFVLGIILMLFFA